jgi:hypothetical protein
MSCGWAREEPDGCLRGCASRTPTIVAGIFHAGAISHSRLEQRCKSTVAPQTRNRCSRARRWSSGLCSPNHTASPSGRVWACPDRLELYTAMMTLAFCDSLVAWLHSAENGLDPESKSVGFVLTCVGHAEGDVFSMPDTAEPRVTRSVTKSV